MAKRERAMSLIVATLLRQLPNDVDPNAFPHSGRFR
jgi:hypothetical protein